MLEGPVFTRGLQMFYLFSNLKVKIPTTLFRQQIVLAIAIYIRKTVKKKFIGIRSKSLKQIFLFALFTKFNLNKKPRISKHLKKILSCTFLFAYAPNHTSFRKSFF